MTELHDKGTINEHYYHTVIDPGTGEMYCGKCVTGEPIVIQKDKAVGISTIMQSFPGGATRESDENKLDYEGFIAPRVLTRYAQYMHKHRKQADGSMRGSDNWQGGMPRERYMKSLIRHGMELWLEWRGDRSQVVMEEILSAILFNTMGLLNELLLNREL